MGDSWLKQGSAPDAALFHRALSADALRKFDEVQLDWAYVDGGHDYETVLGPRVARGVRQAGRHPRRRRHALDAVGVRAWRSVRGEELARHIGRPVAGRRRRGELRAPVSPGGRCSRSVTTSTSCKKTLRYTSTIVCCARLCN